MECAGAIITFGELNALLVPRRLKHTTKEVLLFTCSDDHMPT